MDFKRYVENAEVHQWKDKLKLYTWLFIWNGVITMVIRGEVKANTLTNLYDICNKLFENDDCFYTKEELEQEKTNEKNIFIKKE